MKKVAVIGGKGNMGRRYAMILKEYCDCEPMIFDIGYSQGNMSDCDSYIIATPTDAHYAYLLALSDHKKPILCEKPVLRSSLKLQTLMSIEGLDLSMINQYEFLDDKSSEGHTSYNYFKTGNDGIIWDCINIIGTARTSYDVRNDSLIWKCQLNGKTISIADMDQAYIDNICAWVNGWRNKDYIIQAHQKVMKVVKDA